MAGLGNSSPSARTTNTSELGSRVNVQARRTSDHLDYLWSVLDAPASCAVDQQRIDDAVAELLDMVPYPITLVPPHVYNFYRVRQGMRDQYFTNKSEFGLPPTLAGAPQGRCNREGSQALYFAVTETTALYEACKTRRSQSSEFHLAYISRWQNTAPIRMAKFLDVRAPFRDQHVREKHSSDMQLMAELHPDRIDQIRRLLHLLGRCFVSHLEECPHAYAITNAVSEHVFERFDGIYYSSAMRDAYGSNAALKPELLNGSFAFQCVARVLCAPIDQVGENYMPLTNALGEVVALDGTLAWRENGGILLSSIPTRYIEDNWHVLLDRVGQGHSNQGH